MAIVNTHYGFCAKGGALPQFTYTGNYNMRNDGVVELLTSGTLVFLDPAVIDIFCVGGGASGYNMYSTGQKSGWAGGGGGYTTTQRKVRISKGQSVDINIGKGGDMPAKSFNGSNAGQDTTFGSIVTAKGAPAATNSNGGKGGSGGGGGASSLSTGGKGGSDGSAGENATQAGGSGQANTTREFGESSGKLYSGGGGGGRYIAGSSITSAGGAGGGGTGGWIATGERLRNATSGIANTGGGGGGGATVAPGANAVAGGGGSGICCFRAAK